MLGDQASNLMSFGAKSETPSTKSQRKSQILSLKTRSSRLVTAIIGMKSPRNKSFSVRIGEVLEVGQKGIRKFRIKMSRSLDAEKVVFLRAEGDGWEPITPPQRGESITLTVPSVTNPILP